MALAFEAPGVREDAAYAAQIYATALGGGMSSRLFQELRERRGLCYTIFAQAGAYDDTGLITLYAGTGPEQVRELTELTMDELKRAADGIPKAELERARAQLRAGLLMGSRAPRRGPSGWRACSRSGTGAGIDEPSRASTRSRLRACAPSPNRWPRAPSRRWRCSDRSATRPTGRRWRGGWRPEGARRVMFRRSSSPALETERLALRLPEMADFAPWAGLRRDGEAFLRDWEPSWSPDHLARRAFRNRVYWAWRARDEGRALALFLIRRKDARLLGAITLDNIRRGPAQAAQVGYWIGADFARQGYMTEALAAVVHHAFAALDLSRIEAACLPENAASRALLERAGFSTRAWRRATCRSTAAGATTCSTPTCAATGAAAPRRARGDDQGNRI